VVKIYNDYKDRAEFLTIYVREAHPTDEWQMKSNVKEDVCYAQPKTLEQRVAIANDFVERQKYPLPFGIDDMNNAADLAYSAWPERLSPPQCDPQPCSDASDDRAEPGCSCVNRTRPFGQGTPRCPVALLRNC